MADPRPDALRTPDERFENLPGYNFMPNYVDNLRGYEGLRMHFIDEGPTDAEVTFLCFHGEPSWAYLYRKMIPVLTKAGYRCIAPDFFGFGRSDKPKDDATYTYHFHRNALMRFIEHARDHLGIKNVCTINQDWGGILGLTMTHEFPDLITRLIVANTGLPIGQSPGEGFIAWRDFVATNPKFDVADLMKRATPVLSDKEAAAYGAPFPDPTYMGGVRRFPALVMIAPGMEGIEQSQDAINFYQTNWKGECFMAVGMQDPVLGPKTMAIMNQVIKGSSPLYEMPDAGHFVQEWGDDLATAALKYFKL